MTNTILECPVKFTEGAMKEIRHLMSDKDVPENYVLRIGVKGGGCSGLSYILGFDAKTDNDDEYAYEDIKVIMERGHGMYLIGMEVDFIHGLNNRGFIYNNPNATDTCGCGTSFSAE